MTNSGIEARLNLLHDQVLVLKRDNPKILEHLTNIDKQLTEIWSKIIQLQFDVARIRGGIPGRAYVHNFTLVDNDEAKKLSKGIVDRDTEFNTPTKEAYNRQRSESDPEC